MAFPVFESATADMAFPFGLLVSARIAIAASVKAKLRAANV
jgi:hypothetical protein